MRLSVKLGFTRVAMVLVACGVTRVRADRVHLGSGCRSSHNLWLSDH